MIKSFTKMMFGALCIAMSLVACTKAPTDVAVQSVKLDETSILLYEGETQTLKATVSPKEASNQKVSWASNNPSVASVADGLVTAVAAGDAVITVTTDDGGKTATCAVTVKGKTVPVTSVSLDQTSLDLFVGDKATLVATVLPENATNKAVTWLSSNDNVVTVADGAVEAVGSGEAVITVKTVDGNKTAECSVKVQASEYTVTFITNGGSEVPAQTVKNGERAVKPADPTKVGGLDEGLYEGAVDPDSGSYKFLGWFTDEACTQLFDFNTVIPSDMSLYAGWETTAQRPIVYGKVDGDGKVTAVYPEGYTPTDETKANDVLWVAFDYISSLTLTEKTQFTYVVTKDENYEIGGTLCCPNAEVTVVGRGEPRTIAHNMNCAMFRAESGDLFLGKNLVISGTFNSYSAIILEQDPEDGTPGNVTVLEGCKITNCNANGVSRASAVYNNNGQSKFILDGGEICNNNLEVGAGKAYGGTLCINWGQVIIKSGKVHDNYVSTSDKSIAIGGAGSFPIQSRGNAFQKTGGEIYDNKAEYTGEAVGGPWVGQQLVIGNEARKTEQGLYKVDQNLSATDNLQMDDRTTNPLWVMLWEPGK